MTTDDPHDRPLAIHLRDRMIWLPDVFVAGLRPGRSGAADGYGIGDCVLVDARRGIYAVADASERCPQASRTLLSRFHAAVGTHGGPPTPSCLDAAVAAAFADQEYTARSTFCCVALRWEAHRRVARIINGGDSFAAMVGASDHRMVHRSTPDMGFAGRTKTVPVGVDIDVSENRWRILLATDGWHDLAHPATGEAGTITVLVKALSSGAAPPLKPIPGGDDLAFILIHPGGAPPSSNDAPALMMGGTAAAETTAARGRRTRFQAAAAWLPPHRWPEYRADINDAGIRIVSPRASHCPMEVPS